MHDGNGNELLTKKNKVAREKVLSSFAIIYSLAFLDHLVFFFIMEEVYLNVATENKCTQD